MFSPESLYKQSDKAVLRQLIKLYKNVYDSIDAELKTVYAKYGLPKATPAENLKVLNKVERVDKVRITRLEALKTALAGKLEKDLKEIDALVFENSSAGYAQGYYFNAFAAIDKYKIAIPYPLIDERTVKEALKDPLSYLADSTTNFAVDRKLAIKKINDEVVRGLIRGDNYYDMTKKIDYLLGFRDQKGKILRFDVSRGQVWKSLRILRTETGRFRSKGNIRQLDESQQLGIDAKLKYLATFDRRMRNQSANMDGQISNEKGEFKYPDGKYYVQHQTGNPRWDINDRCTTITFYPDMPDNQLRRIGKKIEPEITFQEWAKREGISKNIFGEVFNFG